jgi:hypothetical protein
MLASQYITSMPILYIQYSSVLLRLALYYYIHSIPTVQEAYHCRVLVLAHCECTVLLAVGVKREAGKLW